MHLHNTGLCGISLSSFFLMYDFSFSSCPRRIHFACVTSSLSLRAINLSLNYHSRDKLRGPSIAQAHDWSSLHYHYLITPSGPWLLVSLIVSGRRWVGGEEAPLPTFCTTYSSNPFLFSASLHYPSNPFSCLHWPTPPPFSDPLNRPLQYRFIRSVKVKVVILSGLLIRPLY